MTIRLQWLVLVTGMLCGISSYSLVAQTTLPGVKTTSYGYVTITSNLEEFLLVVDGDYENYRQFASGDTISMESGLHNLVLVGKNIPDNHFTVQVIPGLTVSKNIQVADFSPDSKSSYNNIINRSNVEIISDAESIIFINGKKAGKSRAVLFLKNGSHLLEVRHPQYGSLKKNFSTSTHQYHRIYRFNKNYSTLHWSVKLLPGAGYLSTKQYNKAILTYTGIGISIIVSQLYLLERNSLKRDLRRARLDYGAFPEPYNLERINDIEDNMDHYKKRSKQSWYVAGLIYLGTTAGGFLKPKEGYKVLPEEVKLSNSFINGQIQPLLTLNLEF